MTTTEGNKMIRKFANHEVDAIKYDYHKDWNTLMDVVEKILLCRKNGDIDIDLMNEDGEACKILHLRIWAEIETVYHAVTQFIQWYNTQSKPTNP